MKGLKKLLTFVVLAFTALIVTACNSQQVIAPTGDNVGSFASYDDLKAYLNEHITTINRTYYSMGGDVAMAEDAVNEADTSTPGSADPRDYSTTNNQVEGVDEADTIITDGYHIYIASGTTFFIVNADTLDIEYSYDIENGWIDGLYVYQNRVVLASYEYTYSESEDCLYTYWGYVYDDEVSVDSSGSDETNPDGTATTEDFSDDSTTTVIKDEYPTTEYCVRWTYTYGTHIRIFDISDLSNVSIARELYFDYAYLADTRMIDEQLYIVLDNYMLSYGYNTDELFVPRYIDTAVSDELVKLRADQIYSMPVGTDSFGYLVLASLDVTKDNEAAVVKSYLGSTYRIYMSENNLYTTVYRYNYLEDEQRWEYNTFILRFEIVDGQLLYQAMAKVEGSPLNQFSMDEYDGVFRIATTGWSYTGSDWEINNFLYCLDATSEDTMTQLSMMADLGKENERIYAARFSGDIAYIVTFVNTDPLYKLDLSDPENPEVLGELYEEGVSDYLHEITSDLMIGIGRQAVTEDGWTHFTGVKVSLYDTTGDTVSNLATYNVSEHDGEYSYSNVAYDHKAFLSFTPQGADFTYVAIPVYEYYNDWYTYSQGLYLFKVHHSGELEFVTTLTNLTEDSNGYAYFDSVERAVIIDNYIYTVSYSSIHMFDINNAFNEVNSQTLNEYYYSYWGYPLTAVDGE